MQLSATYKNKILVLLLVLLCIRLFAMWLIPLTDTTEARYGEIARKMLETDNWITPLHEYNLTQSECAAVACVKTETHNYAVPFWAKPPLSFWSSALSMKLFGVNELAARLPSLVYTLALLLLMMNWLKNRSDHIGLMTITILATNLIFAGSAGLVMTDLSLIFCSTLSMVSFWRAVMENQKRWGWLFFISMGIGLLAKGPLIFILVGLPIGTWTLWKRKLTSVWAQLPWIKGLFLLLLIATPWYWMAELRTPGFIQYFIVGEHFKRFLISGWQGDLYGHAHSEPLGMIWVYLLVGFLPWSFFIAHAIFKNKGTINWKNFCGDDWISYLLSWSTLPILFFTFAHNIIAPYVLPAMPAVACLVAELLVKINNSKPTISEKQFFRIALITPVVFTIAVCAYYAAPDSLPKRSEKDLIAEYIKVRQDHSQLIYFDERLYSADFYSHGHALTVDSLDKISHLIANQDPDFLVVDQRHLNNDLNIFLHKSFKPIISKHKMTLYEECRDKLPCWEQQVH